MALPPVYFENKYKDLEVEELEKEYRELAKEYEFDNKNDSIKYYLDNLLYTSRNKNINTKRAVLEKLLRAKTGRQYNFKINKFNVEPLDIVKYVTDADKDPIWSIKVNEFFEKLQDVSDSEKIKFIAELYQDKKSFNEFLKEVLKTNNEKELFEKYKVIAEKYFAANHVK